MQRPGSWGAVNVTISPVSAESVPSPSFILQRISTPCSIVRLLLSRAMQRKPRSVLTFMTTDEGEMSALKSGPG